MTVDARKNINDLAEFVRESPTSFHAVQAVARRLSLAGFTQLSETEPWTAEVAAHKHFVIRDGAIIAWAGGTEKAAGYRILGAHTDSPGFKVKPRPSLKKFGWNQVGVEVYGGALLNSWLDRELCLAGRLTLNSGDELHRVLVCTEPLARIPQLAIHLNRSANDGLKLDRQHNIYPVWGDSAVEADLLAYLAEHGTPKDIGSADIVGYDLFLADSQPPRVFGADKEFFASGRLDNLSSVHAGLCALERYAGQPHPGAPTVILAAFDHEEIGSATRSGAAGPFLEDILVRLSAARGENPEQYRQSIARSVCLSSDAGHLVHPNYPDHHDPANRPQPGAGPLLKINANQRYATDSVGAGMFALACQKAQVPYQEFVSNNNVPCGSTIGPITATRLGVRTVDVGLGLLSMHSAREMCHVADAAYLTRAIESFYLM